MDQLSILIIEDDTKVAKNISMGLVEAAYSVAVAHSGEEGLSQLMDSLPDALLLDLNLPGRDGIDILRTIKRHYPDLPVLILSARDTVEDRVHGLEQGADDYLIKPFAFSELLARLKVILRREQKKSLLYRIFNIELDVIQRTVKREGERIELTAREFDILELLMRNEGQIVSRQTIAHDVWDQVQRATPLDNVIDVHIMRLRKKLAQENHDDIIQTVRGIGFTLATPKS